MKQLLTKISCCTAAAAVVLAAALATQVDTASAAGITPEGAGAFMLSRSHSTSRSTFPPSTRPSRRASSTRA